MSNLVTYCNYCILVRRKLKNIDKEISRPANSSARAALILSPSICVPELAACVFYILVEFCKLLRH